MDKLLRRDGESKADYQKRIIFGKLVDKTLADYDYTELAPLVYGKEYSGDVARRMFYGSCKTFEALEEDRRDRVYSSDAAREIDQKCEVLRKEQQKYFDQRREYHKLVATEGRREHLEKRLVEAANNLNETVGRLALDSDCLEITADNDAVLFLCDWHYGMKANNVWNTFNVEVCKTRIQKVVGAAIRKLELHKCDTLHIAILGDMIHGAIHTSARVASEELVCEQIMQVSELIAQTVAKLSYFANHTCVHITYGNHARTVQKKEDSIHRDNLERLIPWWIKERLRGSDKISVVQESDDEFLYIDVHDHGICASHGDLDSVKTAPRLFPALMRKKCGKEIECVVLADKHHREGIEELGVTSILCGSLCGTDDYANDKRLYSTPEQLLLIVNHDTGVDAEYHIKCA